MNTMNYYEQDFFLCYVRLPEYHLVLIRLVMLQLMWNSTSSRRLFCSVLYYVVGRGEKVRTFTDMKQHMKTDRLQSPWLSLDGMQLSCAVLGSVMIWNIKRQADCAIWAWSMVIKCYKCAEYSTWSSAYISNDCILVAYLFVWEHDKFITLFKDVHPFYSG